MTQDEAVDPDYVTNAFGFVSLILALVCTAFGFMDIVDPPFSDAELANFVDTWEPQVLGGLLFLAFFALGAVAWAVLAWCGSGPARALFAAASVAFAAAFLLEVTALNILTARTEKVVGHELRWSPFG